MTRALHRSLFFGPIIAAVAFVQACSDPTAEVAGDDAVDDSTGAGEVNQLDVLDASNELTTPGAGAELCVDIICTPLDECHVAGECDSTTGLCTNPTIADGSPCSDGDGCTQVDRCQAGLCLGATPIECVAPDVCHKAGVCDPVSGQCKHPKVKDGEPCTDANKCTTTDSCQSGVCLGTDPVPCLAIDGCHLDGVCDPGTGACNTPEKPNGAPCSDGDACTQLDTCHSGACVGASPIVCLSTDPCLRSGTCDPVTGICSPELPNDGVPCDDNNPCTLEDLCLLDVCKGTDSVVCPEADECHTAGVCDPSTGECGAPAANDGAPCDDGSACTIDDVCADGQCGGSTEVECAAADQCHGVGICDPETGECSQPAVVDGVLCSDNSLCTTNDSCSSGICIGKTPVVCAAPGACHQAGVCDPTSGTCSYATESDGTSCSDGSACTQEDNCQSGECVGAAPVLCAAPGPCHLQGSCDSTTGLCSNPEQPNGTGCSDGDACTQVDVCASGACIGASPVVCAQPGSCHTAGTCDPATGVCDNPIEADGTGCSDGSACTRTDECQSGVCVGSDAVVCASPAECHAAGTCDPATGDCSTPDASNGTSCSDDDPCTAFDTCQLGSCAPGVPVLCPSTGPCHQNGICDSITGNCSDPVDPDGTPCSDGKACTQEETCQAGLCTGGLPVVCLATGTCRDAGTCSPLTGLCSNPQKQDGSSCNDNDPCTTVDKCQSGTCVGTGCGGGVLFYEDFENDCSSGCPLAGYVGDAGAWSIATQGTNGPCPNEFFVSNAENGSAAGQCGSSGQDESLHIGNQSCSPSALLYCPSGDCGASYDATGACSSLGCTFGLCECGAGPIVQSNRSARSPVINATGRSNLVVTFNYIEGGQGANDNADFEWYDGTTWSTVALAKTSKCSGQGLWTAFTYTLPAAANNNPKVQVGFRWINNADNQGADPSFAVDDVTITAN